MLDSGSTVTIDTSSSVLGNSPHNLACDNNCVVTGMKVTCSHIPLGVIAIVSSACTTTGNGNFELSTASLSLVPDDNFVSVWVGPSKTAHANITGGLIASSCVVGVGSFCLFRVWCLLLCASTLFFLYMCSREFCSKLHVNIRQCPRRTSVC